MGKQVFKFTSLKYYVPHILVSILAGFFVYFPLTDSDIWWHLATAREMIANKSFLFKDPFSFTVSNPLWVNLHWIFQLLCYGLFSTTGVTGLIIFKCIMVSFVCVLQPFLVPSRTWSLLSIIISAILFYEAQFLVLVRPVLITILCMLFFILLFESYRRSGRVIFLILLIPIQILWTNSQGLFAISLGLCFAYWAESLIESFLKKKNAPGRITVDYKRTMILTVTTFLLMLTFLVNPYGIHAFVYPGRLLARILPFSGNIYSLNISENIPLPELIKTNSRIVYSTLIITSITLMSFAVNIRRIRISHLLLIVIFGILAFMAERNILLYFVIVPPVLITNLWSSFSSMNPDSFILKSKKGIASTLILIGFIFLFFDTNAHLHQLSIYPSSSMISPFRFPDKAVDFIKEHKISGNIFNDIRYGGYLLWNLPGKKVFIDGRLIIRSPQFFAEYLTIYDHPEVFTNVAERFNITHVLLPTAIFYRSLPLVNWLYQSQDWKLTFTDGSSVLFYKSDKTTCPALNLGSDTVIHSILDTLHSRWASDPYIFQEACYNAATLLKFLGLYNNNNMELFHNYNVSSQFEQNQSF